MGVDSQRDMGWSIDYYKDIRNLIDAKATVWDNNGWAIRGSSVSREVLLWVSPYYLKCGTNCPYIADELSTWQIMAICVPKARKINAPMEDNDFVADGWYPSDLKDGKELKITQSKAGVKWEIGSSSIICNPPDWKIRQRKGRVTLNVSLHTQFPPVELRSGSEPGADFKWHMADAEANGEATILGENIRFRGFAHHERHTHAREGFDPAQNKTGKGIWWLALFGTELRVFLQLRPTLGIAKAWIFYRGKVNEVEGKENIRLREERHWYDPRSQLLVPSAWQIKVQSSEMTIRARVWAQARAYYLWSYLRNSYTLLYWWLAQGIIYPNDNQTKTTTECKCFVHSNKIFMMR